MVLRRLCVASEACCGCARHGARRHGGQQQDEEEGGGSKDGWRSLACSEPTAGAGRAFARGGRSRRPAATLAARPQRASGQPVSSGLVAASAATSAAAEDDVLQDKVDTIAERELDRDDEQQQEWWHTSAQIIKLASNPVPRESTRRKTLSQFRCKRSKSSSAVRALPYCAWVTFLSSRSVRGKYKSRSTSAQVVLSRGKDVPDDFCQDIFFPRFSITATPFSLKRSSAARRRWPAAQAIAHSTWMATTRVQRDSACDGECCARLSMRCRESVRVRCRACDSVASAHT